MTHGIVTEDVRETFADRLAARIRRGSPDECWPWRGATNTWGYGVIRRGARRVLTHRAALELAEGHAPADKTLALHSCHNPPCCNPSHLRWGSNQDNRNDRATRDMERARLNDPDARLPGDG